jgi:hypothetical protein
MNKHALIVALLAIAVVGVVFAGYFETSKAPADEGRVCTMDAKLCPDGSYVGRTGPNCEFSACPVGTGTQTGPVTISAKIGQTATALGVTLIPLNVLEDSRCPVDVQCIQAGTVRMQARLGAGMGTSTQEFKLGQPITTETETVTLTEVTPVKRAGTSIGTGDYVFTFEIAKRPVSGSGGIAPYDSGVRGTVLLGPTCPVMRDPPDPKCADKPYATTVTARRAGSTATFATTQSGATGMFEFALPPGSYTLAATGGTMLPRCAEKNITVSPSSYVSTIISCDTGIR